MPVVAVFGLAILLTAFVAYGSSGLARSSSAGFLGWLANQFSAIPIIGGWTAKQITALTKWLSHEIGAHFQQVVHAASAFIAGLQQYVALMALPAITWPFELFKVLVWLQSVAIPKAAKVIPGPAKVIVGPGAKVVGKIEAQIAALAAQVKALPHTAAKVVIPRITIPYIDQWQWLRKHWKALTALVLGAAAILNPHLPRITITLPKIGAGNLSGIRKRLKHLEAITTGAGLLALVWLALRRLGLKWLRCPNVGKVGRALCHFPSGLLDALLLGSFEALAATDVCLMAKVIEAAAGEFEPVLNELVNLDSFVCLSGGATLPSAITAAEAAGSGG